MLISMYAFKFYSTELHTTPEPQRLSGFGLALTTLSSDNNIMLYTS